MVYPNTHLYVTTHWTSVLDEIGQCGIRFDLQSMPSTAEQTAVVTATSTFWAAVDTDIAAAYAYQFTKFAIIEPSGLYPPDGEAEIAEPAAPVAGGNSGASSYPLQTACVASLLTAAQRGRAHRGRIYLPPIEAGLTTQASWPALNANNRAEEVATWINGLEVALGGEAHIFSKVGAGTKREVAGVVVGARPDVQRRRANAIPESYSSEFPT